MAIHKLYINEFEDADYQLIAIHTSLEDYRLAYFLNKELNIFLSKSKEDIHTLVKEGETFFTRFTFDDEENDVVWDLVQNKNEVTINENNQTTDLFSNSDNTFIASVFLLSEFKKVDYFLKINNSEKELNTTEIINKISKIETIKLVYNVDKNKLKSKNNLIF